jgi:hypothetical protein
MQTSSTLNTSRTTGATIILAVGIVIMLALIVVAY